MSLKEFGERLSIKSAGQLFHSLIVLGKRVILYSVIEAEMVLRRLYLPSLSFFGPFEPSPKLSVTTIPIANLLPVHLETAISTVSVVLLMTEL